MGDKRVQFSTCGLCGTYGIPNYICLVTSSVLTVYHKAELDILRLFALSYPLSMKLCSWKGWTCMIVLIGFLLSHFCMCKDDHGKRLGGETVRSEYLFPRLLPSGGRLHPSAQAKFSVLLVSPFPCLRFLQHSPFAPLGVVMNLAVIVFRITLVPPGLPTLTVLLHILSIFIYFSDHPIWMLQVFSAGTLTGIADI